jgi:serine/threonine protein kinase/Tol biopolymer transport system component
MSLAPGTRLGFYEVTAQIGAGGMGEVYRAHDSRLNRDVALKVLPAAFANDADRLARFRREAQALAALNHPNVGAIYGFEEAQSMEPGGATTHALVLELVEGPTLADRIAQGPIPVAEALPIARQVALALEAAHERGLIHRDLKPANIKVRDDGAVKVLDFGLAKAMLPEEAKNAGDTANSPTLTNRATELGVILGTAAYMAPEQAKGRVVDRRADIWAFGVVLYEMLTGRRLFRGEDASDTLAEVLKSDPDWTALPKDTPSSIRRLLRRCLTRDPMQRLRDAADARFEVEEAMAPAPAADSVTSTTGRPARRERLLWILALVAATVTAVIFMLRPRPSVAPLSETRFQVATPTIFPGTASFSLSPDGRALVYSTLTPPQLWLRPLESEEARPLPGTENAGPMYWSYDGQSILFFDGSGMKQFDLASGKAHAVPDKITGFGATWNADGVILFAPANAAPIARVQSGGGAREDATRIVPPQVGHRFPYFLPDGKHFVFLATGPLDVQGIYLGALDSKDSQRLVAADTAAVFLSPSYLVFGRQDTLFAQSLDPATFQPVGQPVVVADQPLQTRNVFGSVALAASRSGTLAYRRAIPLPHQLTWFDRLGKRLGTVGDVDTAETNVPPHVSPDGRTIALARRVGGNTDIWLIDNAPQGTYQRWTTEPAIDTHPNWSADGRRIAYQSSRKGGGFYDLYERSVDGSAPETVLIESAENKMLTGRSRDGRFILYSVQFHQQTDRDIWALPLAGDRKPFPVFESPFDKINGRFSPDGRWIAYQTDDNGRAEVYVRPFPGPGRSWRISTNGGTWPEWGRDGELFYLAPNGTVMFVPLTLASNGSSVDRGTPMSVVTTRPGSLFTVSADGQRILVNYVLEDVRTPPITLILNWKGKN